MHLDCRTDNLVRQLLVFRRDGCVVHYLSPAFELFVLFVFFVATAFGIAE